MTGLRCRIDGDRGTLEFDLYQQDLRGESEVIGGGPFELEPVQFLPSMSGSMGDLLISIEEKREPQVSARRNLMTMRQVLAERDSAHAGGTWISLPAGSP